MSLDILTISRCEYERLLDAVAEAKADCIAWVERADAVTRERDEAQQTRDDLAATYKFVIRERDEARTLFKEALLALHDSDRWQLAADLAMRCPWPLTLADRKPGKS